MLTRLALRAPIVTIALMLVVLGFGAYSLSKLKIALFPDFDFPVVTVAVFYPQATPDMVLADVTLPIEQAVANVPNVKTVTSTSSPSFSTVVIEAPFGKDMKAMERTVQDRVQALNFPAGVQPPKVARINPDEFPIVQISVMGNRTLPDLYSIVTNQVIPELQKIPGVYSADVPLGSDTGISITRTNGLPSLGVSILKTPDANTVEVADAVIKKLDDLRDQLPADLKFIQISNQAPSIQHSVNELKTEVLLGAILAVLVIFAFLLSVRPTLVTSISIPVSIMAAAIVMSLQGMSLNILTLGGLAIAVGRVVDDSIVVMENIFRHIQLGEDRRSAALNATREVALPITSSTMTTIAVFAPLGLIGGFISVIFMPFALTITYALVASLVVALTIVPVLGSLIITRSNRSHSRDSWLVRVYTTMLRWALAHKAQTLLIGLVLFFASLALVRFIPISFLPSEEATTLNVEVSVTGAPTREEILQQLGLIETSLAKLRNQQSIDNYQTSVGNTGLFSGMGGTAPGTAIILVQLHEGVKASQMASVLREDLAGEGRIITVSEASLHGPGSNNLQISLLGENYANLAASADKITTALQNIQGLVNVKNDIVIAPVNGNSLDAATIRRINGHQAVTISGTIAERNTGMVQRQVQNTINEIGLPPGVEQSTGGVFASMGEAFSKMGIAMLLGVGLVYLVMMIAQRSFVTPFVIILSLPMASIGALGGLFLTQRSLGLPALIGLLMLIGLVVTNAIVLIAFVEQLRAKGLPLTDAVIEGARTRLRPILMTALTTIFVLMPLAVGLGGQSSGIIGAELATVVIGGLMTATFLTLLIVPVVYSLLRKKGPRASSTTAAN